MQCTIVTLFPEFFDSPLKAGLMGRALAAGGLTVGLVDPRTAARDRHRTVDDRPYGGGPGMVMLSDPLARTLRGIARPGRMVLLAPHGRLLTQALAVELAQEEALTLVCGRYEGIDARLEEAFGLEAVSVGDYVLNGGETAALALLEAVARLIPGFMGKEASGEEESFSSGLLEYPHYTRPEEFEGRPAPEVLRSGDHGKIAAWRRAESLRRTLRMRPDLLDAAELTRVDLDCLAGMDRARAGRNLSIALVHYPVLDKWNKSVAVSLTNLDVHDLSRCARTYGAAALYVATPLVEQRALLESILAHWCMGPAARTNPDRAEALSLAQGTDSLAEAISRVTERAGERPLVISTSARLSCRKKARFSAAITPAQVRAALERRPVLLVFGTGHGLAPEALALCDAALRPLRCISGYNHLPVRSAVAIMLDRILGDWY